MVNMSTLQCPTRAIKRQFFHDRNKSVYKLSNLMKDMSRAIYLIFVERSFYQAFYYFVVWCLLRLLFSLSRTCHLQFLCIIYIHCCYLQVLILQAFNLTSRKTSDVLDNSYKGFVIMLCRWIRKYVAVMSCVSLSWARIIASTVLKELSMIIDIKIAELFMQNIN